MSVSKEHDHAALTAQAIEFNQHFPLPVRILVLISIGILLFASNLHILSNLGIDTAAVLDVRSETLPLGQSTSSPTISTQSYIHPSKLYKPIYTLAFIYFTWTGIAWILLSLWSDSYPWTANYVPAAFAVLGVLVVFLPTERLQKKERYMFLRLVLTAPRNQKVKYYSIDPSNASSLMASGHQFLSAMSF